jgi:hypothetical protein
VVHCTHVTSTWVVPTCWLTVSSSLLPGCPRGPPDLHWADGKRAALPPLTLPYSELFRYQYQCQKFLRYCILRQCRRYCIF